MKQWALERTEEVWKLEVELVGSDCELSYRPNPDAVWAKLTPAEASNRRLAIVQRLAAVWELTRRNDPLMEQFAAFANDATLPPHQRRLAMTLLACLPQEKALDTLLSILHTDPNTETRMLALEAVGAGQGRYATASSADGSDFILYTDFSAAAVPPLRPAGRWTSTPLGRGKSVDAILDVLMHEADQAMRSKALELLSASLPGYPGLDTITDRGDPPDRERALDSVARIARSDASADMRKDAVSAFRLTTDHPQVTGLVIDLARGDSSEDVRKAALYKLDEIWTWPENAVRDAPEIGVAFDALGSIARDPSQSRWVRQSAIDTIGAGLGARHEPALRFFQNFILSATEPTDREYAISLFGQRSIPEAVSVLRQVVASDTCDEVRKYAQERLRYIERSR